ncbi:MAG: exodeoxyribonuclease VII large subunit [Candidatus Neomarinimicrobiota bacterium]|nr:exodeoxyribonuclease VII large subunit [Candidatus Neomarinimicrobiota bacterium]MEC9474967.1 exodeoxyribonuclease VII large subunit [Candidatus Neomarinimicrobiota bacterium]|tara:strand:- start:634 stop:1830 length:1197 start_codon:yes stop_codon:yes gene_type:complete
MQYENALTVSELTVQIKTLIESSYSSVIVRGEISNFTHHSSGHMYFTMKDKHSELRAVMFKGKNNSLSFTPKNGTDVILQGKLSVYEARGQYQIIAQHMEPAGIGALFLAFEELKKRLLAEGLFDKSKKKPLPKFPSTVGIVTSKTGAALRDMLIIFKRRAPQVKIIIRSALVQGSDAAQDIVNGIKELSSLENIDLIIIGRGGGSFEDLWPFNEEVLVRQISQCEKPIISAVGHETDITISDMVADLRAPTPSAAAEIAINNIFEISQSIDNKLSRLINLIGSKISSIWQTFDNLSERHILQKPKTVFNRQREIISQSCHSLNISIRRIISLKRTSVVNLRTNLDALSPNNTLNRGYSIAYDKNRSIIRKPDDVDDNDPFTLKTAKGEMAAIKKSST